MFSNHFCVLPQQNVPCICECVGTRVHYGDILNLSQSSVCSSSVGTLGPASIFPDCATGHGHVDPDWQSSPPSRRPPPPRWEDGSLVRSRFGGGLKIKDREVRAWFYWWAVDVLGVCAALKPWHTEWCAGRGHMHTRSYEHVDSGSFKLLRGICMCFVTLHNFVCVCVGGGCVSSSFLGSEPL